MSDVIIARGGRESGSSSGSIKLVTQVFTNNDIFIVPEAINNEFDIRIFGGGGAGKTDRSDSYDHSVTNGGSGICIIKYYSKE